MIRAATGLVILAAATVSMGAAPQDSPKAAGQQHRVCGTVVEVKTLPKNCDVALYIGNPSVRRTIAAVVPRSLRANLPKRPEEYLHDEVCVSGAISERQKQAFIDVRATEQIELSRPSAPPFATGIARPCDVGAVMPDPIKEVEPRLAPQVLKDGAQGAVEVEVVVREDGTVGDTRLLKRVHTELDEAALNAARQWKFRPGSVDSKPVAMVVILEFTFSMR